jgi:hypothetical protein
VPKIEVPDDSFGTLIDFESGSGGNNTEEFEIRNFAPKPTKRQVLTMDLLDPSEKYQVVSLSASPPPLFF